VNAIRCSNCSFLGFADNGCCKRCGHGLQSLISQRSSQRPQVAESSRQSRKTLAMIAILVVVGGAVALVFVRGKLRNYFDKTPAYIAAIGGSSRFREPITVRVNQNEVHSLFEMVRPFEGRQPGIAVKAASVLEALGLLTMSTETTVSTTQIGESIPQVYEGAVVGHTQPQFLETRSARLVIALTEEGRKEALNWTETSEAYLSINGRPVESTKTLWWRIPIGERELTGIDSVRELDANTVAITFRWRWKPNKIGESFDSGGDAVSRLPERARSAVAALAWNSQTEYSGDATLHRSDNSWIAKVYFPNSS
jgi:hypothetical protein